MAEKCYCQESRPGGSLWGNPAGNGHSRRLVRLEEEAEGGAREARVAAEKTAGDLISRRQSGYDNEVPIKHAFCASVRGWMSGAVTRPERRRVVLLFGEPDHGDCYLVRQLRDAYGYHVLRLDQVYVDFVLSRYPSYYFPGLCQVVAPHYQIIMRHLVGGGTSGLECFFEDWGDYVAGVVAEAACWERRVVVEGWSLLPAPGAIRARLVEMASVTVVEACNGRRCDAGTVAHLHHDADTPFRRPHDFQS